MQKSSRSENQALMSHGFSILGERDKVELSAEEKSQHTLRRCDTLSRRCAGQGVCRDRPCVSCNGGWRSWTHRNPQVLDHLRYRLVRCEGVVGQFTQSGHGGVTSRTRGEGGDRKTVLSGLPTRRWGAVQRRCAAALGRGEQITLGPRCVFC